MDSLVTVGSGHVALDIMRRIAPPTGFSFLRFVGVELLLFIYLIIIASAILPLMVGLWALVVALVWSTIFAATSIAILPLDARVPSVLLGEEIRTMHRSLEVVSANSAISPALWVIMAMVGIALSFAGRQYYEKLEGRVKVWKSQEVSGYDISGSHDPVSTGVMASRRGWVTPQRGAVILDHFCYFRDYNFTLPCVESETLGGFDRAPVHDEMASVGRRRLLRLRILRDLCALFVFVLMLTTLSIASANFLFRIIAPLLGAAVVWTAFYGALRPGNLIPQVTGNQLGWRSWLVPLTILLALFGVTGIVPRLAFAGWRFDHSNAVLALTNFSPILVAVIGTGFVLRIWYPRPGAAISYVGCALALVIWGALAPLALPIGTFAIVLLARWAILLFRREPV